MFHDMIMTVLCVWGASESSECRFIEYIGFGKSGLPGRNLLGREVGR